MKMSSTSIPPSESNLNNQISSATTLTTNQGAVGTTSQNSKHDEKDKLAYCWKYFEVVEDTEGKKYAKCTIDKCGKMFAYSNQTSSMNRHLLGII